MALVVLLWKKHGMSDEIAERRAGRRADGDSGRTADLMSVALSNNEHSRRNRAR